MKFNVFILHNNHTVLSTACIMLILLCLQGTSMQGITGFRLKCPKPPHWNMRAKSLCRNVSCPSYTCLFDEIQRTTVEICEKNPDFQTPGFKFVLRGGYDGEPCLHSRFQPFKFWTNGNTDCVFRKSSCSGEGQLMLNDGSTTNDVMCRCDYTKGYAFITEPTNICFCEPFKEDCSCYKKKCFKHEILTPDYECKDRYQLQQDKLFCPSVYKSNRQVKAALQHRKNDWGENRTNSHADDRCLKTSLIPILILIQVIAGCIVLSISNCNKPLFIYQKINRLKANDDFGSSGEGPVEVRSLGSGVSLAMSI